MNREFSFPLLIQGIFAEPATNHKLTNLAVTRQGCQRKRELCKGPVAAHWQGLIMWFHGHAVCYFDLEILLEEKLNLGHVYVEYSLSLVISVVPSSYFDFVLV